MNNKNKVYITLLFAILCSFHTVWAAQSNWSNFMENNFMWWNTDNSASSDFSTDTSIDSTDTSTDNTSSVSNDDASTDNADIKENLNFSKDAEIWYNVTVTWNITADKNLVIGDNSEITWNIIVIWDLKIWFNVKIDGYIKVLWKIELWDNSEVTWNIYWYKTIILGFNTNTSGKLKSSWLFTMWDNYEWKWKLYTFSSKKTWFNTKFADKKEKWILWKLDAYLKIDISEDEFAQVQKISQTYDWALSKIISELKKSKVSVSVAKSKLKMAKTDTAKEEYTNTIASMNEKISTLKSEWKDLIDNLVIETEQYLESEDFDIKWVSVYIRNEELSKLDISQIMAKEILTKVEDKVENKNEEKVTAKEEIKDNLISNSSVKDEKMKVAIRWLLEKKLASFNDEKKTKMYEILATKLTTMIEKSNNEKMKHTLILLQEVVQDMQNEWSIWLNIDDLLKNSLTPEDTSSPLPNETETSTK